MRFPRHRSPRVAIALICGCALVNLCVFQRDVWRHYATQDRSVAEQFVARYEPLRSLMPSGEVVKFMLDGSHVESTLVHPEGRIRLAQYAVSPQRLSRCTESRWVVVDSDSPEIVPEVAASAHWTLSADLRNGVRLYRTDVVKE